MEKIDLNLAKKIIAIKAAEDRETWPERIERRQKNFENILRHPRIVGTNPDDIFDLGRKLFIFKKKYHSVTSSTYKKLTLAEAETFLKEDGVKTYYLCISSGTCPVPELMIGADATGVSLKDETAVVDYINTTGNIKITKKDL